MIRNPLYSNTSLWKQFLQCCCKNYNFKFGHFGRINCVQIDWVWGNWNLSCKQSNRRDFWFLNYSVKQKHKKRHTIYLRSFDLTVYILCWNRYTQTSHSSLHYQFRRALIKYWHEFWSCFVNCYDFRELVWGNSRIKKLQSNA